MILPQKHVSITESMFGFGGQLLALIDNKTSVDQLWESYLASNSSSFKHGFDNFILALDYLFIIEAIVIDDCGCISLETY